MPHPLKLEVFETADTPEGPALLMPEEIEDIRLNAYERGYLAGWDDGGQQVQTDETARREAIERQAEQLNFTYHEARGHVLKALLPMLEGMLSCVLPTLARASIVPLAIEHLTPLAHGAADAPLTLRVPSGSRDAYLAAFEGLVLPPLDLVETDDLAEGQALFVLGEAETHIDLTHAAEEIRRAIDRFYLIQTEESQLA
ncbi:hypothetical protein [Pararhodobacter zhoushanensis]|uniref:Flagellar biosynthesis protein n=1 Tax=Pararhodobacter zhoushanensis TaxID=2479545 RepID=A0ABT3GY26_9RHOB|nr:hypothetical protein [Pararhodobacter zhoushanensis]MCW1932395.1 hypothetical protein [Pararhodobacter zhoushanensis]